MVRVEYERMTEIYRIDRINRMISLDPILCILYIL